MGKNRETSEQPGGNANFDPSPPPVTLVATNGVAVGVALSGANVVGWVVSASKLRNDTVR